MSLAETKNIRTTYSNKENFARSRNKLRLSFLLRKRQRVTACTLQSRDLAVRMALSPALNNANEENFEQ